MSGAIHPADPNRQWHIDIISKAVKLHDPELELVNIEDLTQQIVAGSIFRGVLKAKKHDVTAKYNFDIWKKPGPDDEIEINSFTKQ